MSILKYYEQKLDKLNELLTWFQYLFIYRLRIKTAPDPDLVRYYCHLQKLLSQGEEMSQKYHKMADSLNNGESTYQIKEAQVLRMQVMKVAETVPVLAKKIEELPPDDAKCAKLQVNILQSNFNIVLGFLPPWLDP